VRSRPEKPSTPARDELIAAVPDIGEAGWYFRVFNGKRNFAPPADESKWFKHVNVEIEQ
jgi:hypothetical protein